MSASPHITVDHLTVHYRKHCALQDICCAFYQGDLVGIIGPNGGGKSTFLKALLSLLKPTYGCVRMEGYQQQHFAYLPQKAHLDHQFPLTVLDVVAMGLWKKRKIFKKYNTGDIACIQEALEQVGMAEHHNRPIHSLSGGQFQRMLFARLIIQDAQVILLDEPFTSIDKITRDLLMGLILKWHRQQKVILIVLHEMDIVKNFIPSSLLLAQKMIAFGKTDMVMTEQNIQRAFNVQMTLRSMGA